MNIIPIIEGYPDHIRVRMEQRALHRARLFPEQMNGQSTELVFEDLLLWDMKSIQVSFKGGDADLHQKIAEAAAEWSEYANIVFDFGYNATTQKYREWVPDDQSQVRVGFQDAGYWSLVGKDSQDPQIISPGEITLNLEKFDIELPSNYKGIVLHEFGHSLGFHHEHQSPVANCDFDWEAVYKYLAGPPNYWSKEKVDFNLRQMPAGGLTYSPHDKDSIMHYAFPAWMFFSGKSSLCFTEENDDLSAEDKKMAGKAYPFEEEESQDQGKRREFQLELLEQYKRGSGGEREGNLTDRIKKCILIASGQANENPDHLMPDMELGNLLPTAAAKQFLADLLDELVKTNRPEQELKLREIEKCSTVGDCIRLVQSKL